MRLAEQRIRFARLIPSEFLLTGKGRYKYPNTLRTLGDDYMQVITSVNGLLRTLSATETPSSAKGRTIRCGLSAIDELLPGGGFSSGMIHEVLSQTDTPSLILPALVARAAARFGWIAWLDVARELFPPALEALGIPLHRLLVLRPANRADELWAVAECLKCNGISGCIAALPQLSRIQARRLQLAAESGGGIGLVLRPAHAISWPYAAATRWLIKPAQGERMIQRCSVELIHGHGGRIGQSVLLEMNRETHHVRTIETVADRQAQTQTAAASA